MDIPWHGILTCDYEHDRPHASPLERELYTRSLIRWPAVFLGDPSPYGRLRRPGIVDILEDLHHGLVSRLHARVADPLGARAIARQLEVHRAHAATALQDAESSAPAPAAMSRAAHAVLDVMSAHIVNWLLPEEHWETRTTKLLGSRTAARECIAALSVPVSNGHLLTELHRAGPAEHEPANCPAATARNEWLTAALLSAAGDAPSLDAVRAMAITLQCAAESEERRRELRERFLSLASRWCAQAGRDPRLITFDDLSVTAGAR